MMALYPDTEYRAAYIGDCRLTGPEHAHLSNTDLLRWAIAEAESQGLIGDEPHQVTADQIRIGIWREHRQS